MAENSIKYIPPILLTVFNRPSTTKRVLDAIRLVRPSELYIVADGPRQGKDDENLCKEVRKIFDDIDWPCNVKTLFRDQNKGCGTGIQEAISWFFSQVEYGIILEDDCLPSVSFFDFCQELLIRYRSDRNVMAISGTNLLPTGWRKEKQSYMFCHGGNWGWATWKRAWLMYDKEMTGWKKKETQDKIRKNMNSDYWFHYYRSMFEGAYNGEIVCWDLQWFYTILNNNSFSICPSVNLVKNIGFGPGATNTNEPYSAYAHTTLNEIDFPLKHPPKRKMDIAYLRQSYKHVVKFDKTNLQYRKHMLRLYILLAKNAFFKFLRG